MYIYLNIYCLALYIIPIPLEILFLHTQYVQSSLVYDQLSHQDILHNLL